jgi:hypothetical protein
MAAADHGAGAERHLCLCSRSKWRVDLLDLLLPPPLLLLLQSGRTAACAAVAERSCIQMRKATNITIHNAACLLETNQMAMSNKRVL